MRTSATPAAQGAKRTATKTMQFLKRLLAQGSDYDVAREPVSHARSLRFKGKPVARFFTPKGFQHYMEISGIDWARMAATMSLPDCAIVVHHSKALFLVFIKEDAASEGHDSEALPVCDYERRHYNKLLAPLGLKVEYVYLLGKWFEKPKHRDVLDYIHSVNCHYMFNQIPLSWLGLPS